MRIKMYIYILPKKVCPWGVSVRGGSLYQCSKGSVRLRGADSERDNWLWLGASNQSRCVTVKISPCTRVTACRPSRRALSAGHYLQFLLFNWGPARANASSRGDAQPAAHNYNAEEIIFSAPPQPVALPPADVPNNPTSLAPLSRRANPRSAVGMGIPMSMGIAALANPSRRSASVRSHDHAPLRGAHQPHARAHSLIR